MQLTRTSYSHVLSVPGCLVYFIFGVLTGLLEVLLGLARSVVLRHAACIVGFGILGFNMELLLLQAGKAP